MMRRLVWFVLAVVVSIFGSAGPGLAQTTGTSYSPLLCPAQSAVDGCNAQDVNTISVKLANEIEACTGPTDTGTAEVDVTYTTNSQRYNITTITSLSGESVAGGDQCMQTYLGSRTAGTYTDRITVTYQCADLNANGIIDIDTVFGWDIQSGSFTAPVPPSSTPTLREPKCVGLGPLHIEGLSAPVDVTAGVSLVVPLVADFSSIIGERAADFNTEDERIPLHLGSDED